MELFQATMLYIMLLIRREMGVVKTDSRIIQTKRAIKNEIISLLQKYPLNKITVKMSFCQAKKMDFLLKKFKKVLSHF